MSKTRGFLAILLLVVAGMLIAACGGGDDDDDAGNGDDQTGATATATAEPGQPTDAPDTTDGASDPTDAPDTDFTGDACGLVSQSEAEEALGSPLQAPYITYTATANVGLTSAQATVSTCAYIADAGIPSANITLWLSPGNASALKTTMGDAACINKEMIDGMGDVACWYDSQHLEIQLVTGSAFIDIFATVDGDATDALLDMAEAAVGRLS